MKFNAPLRVYGFGMVLRQGTWPVGNQKSGFYEFTFFLLHLDISLFYFIWFVTIGKDGHSRAEYKDRRYPYRHISTTESTRYAMSDRSLISVFALIR